MKISKTQLRQIIKEELEALREAGWGGAAAWLDEPEEEPQKRHLPFSDDPEEEDEQEYLPWDTPMAQDFSEPEEGPHQAPDPELEPTIRGDVDRPPHLSRQQWAALKKKLKSTGQTSWAEEYPPLTPEEIDLLLMKLTGVTPEESRAYAAAQNLKK